MNLLTSIATEEGGANIATLAGLTTLEIILVSACGVLSTTIGVVWKWGNDIRKENSIKFGEMGREQTRLIVEQTADNKDVVHALTDMSKTIERMAASNNTGPQLVELKSMLSEVRSLIQQVVNR